MHVWAPPPPCSVGDYQMHVALNKDKQKRDSKARVLASAMKMKEIHFLTIKSWRFTLRRNTLVKQWSTFGGQIRNPNTSFLNILLNVYRVCRQLRLHKLARGAGKGGLAPSTAPCTDGWAVPICCPFVFLQLFCTQICKCTSDTPHCGFAELQFS